MRKQTKNQTKTPAAPKPAKTKGEAAPLVVLPTLPPNCSAAIPLLAAAALDLPNARREGNAARFVALLDEWEAFAATPEAQVETTVAINGAEYSTGETPASRAFDALEAGPFREDPRAYYAAEVAQLSRRAILAARRILEPLDAAAVAAVCSACARLFDALGPLVREYREAWPYEEGRLTFRHDLCLKISARLDGALAALAECARNPPPVAGKPADLRRVLADMEAAAERTAEAVAGIAAGAKKRREGGRKGGRVSARSRGRNPEVAKALDRMGERIREGKSKSILAAARWVSTHGAPLLKSNGEELKPETLARYYKARTAKRGRRADAERE